MCPSREFPSIASGAILRGSDFIHFGYSFLEFVVLAFLIGVSLVLSMSKFCPPSFTECTRVSYRAFPWQIVFLETTPVQRD